MPKWLRYLSNAVTVLLIIIPGVVAAIIATGNQIWRLPAEQLIQSILGVVGIAIVGAGLELLVFFWSNNSRMERMDQRMQRLEQGQTMCHCFRTVKEADKVAFDLLGTTEKKIRQIAVGVGENLAISRAKAIAQLLRRRKDEGAKVYYDLVIVLIEEVTIPPEILAHIDKYMECFQGESVSERVRVRIIQQKPPFGYNWLFFDKRHEFFCPGFANGDIKDIMLFEDLPAIIEPHVDWFDSEVFRSPAAEPYDKVKQSSALQNTTPPAVV